MRMNPVVENGAPSEELAINGSGLTVAGEKEAEEMAQPGAKRPRVWGLVYCPHCDQKVSKTTFYRHRKSFFSATTKTWSKVMAPICDSDSDSSSSTEHVTDQDDIPVTTDSPPSASKPAGIYSYSA